MCIYCTLYTSFFLQNSSMDRLLDRLPAFLQRLNSQNNVKVRHVCARVCVCVGVCAFFLYSWLPTWSTLYTCIGFSSWIPSPVGG